MCVVTAHLYPCVCSYPWLITIRSWKYELCSKSSKCSHCYNKFYNILLLEMLTFVTETSIIYHSLFSVSIRRQWFIGQIAWWIRSVRQIWKFEERMGLLTLWSLYQRLWFVFCLQNYVFLPHFAEASSWSSPWVSCEWKRLNFCPRWIICF